MAFSVLSCYSTKTSKPCEDNVNENSRSKIVNISLSPTWRIYKACLRSAVIAFDRFLDERVFLRAKKQKHT